MAKAVPSYLQRAGRVANLEAKVPDEVLEDEGNSNAGGSPSTHFRDEQIPLAPDPRDMAYSIRPDETIERVRATGDPPN